jgi:hypothetical protein
MVPPQLARLYAELTACAFNFVPRGEYHLQDVHRAVQNRFPDLCDDNVLCEQICTKGTKGPEWQHRVRAALQALKSESGPITKSPQNGYWIFTSPRVSRTTSDQLNAIIKLQPVSAEDDIRENVRRFNRDATDYETLATTIVRRTKYWVFDEDENNFGPSKFAGLCDMTFDRYEAGLAGHTTDAHFDGGVTRNAIARLLGDYRSDTALSGQLKERLARRFGPDILNGVDVTKWEFVRLPVIRQYWAIQNKRTVFLGLEASCVLDEMVWRVPLRKKRNPKPGDRLIVWQARERGPRRGVVVVGEVTAGPKVILSPPEEHRFWQKKIGGPEPRIRFRVIRLPGLPVWEDGENSWLSELKVAGAQGTLFTLEPGQWHRIVAQAAQGQLPERRRTGQGFSTSPEARRAIELHAQRMAETYYADLGYEVKDVSSDHPYDIHCKKGDGELHIEVKGTMSSGNSVLLTRNEVAHARQNRERAVLVIVAGIELSTINGRPRPRGGDMRVVQPWDVDTGALSPTQYEYQPPTG